jgi:hypothetical protein
MTTVLAGTVDGIWAVELGDDGDAVVEHRPGEELPPRPRPVELVPAFVSASLVDVDALGAAVVVAVERRPPLLVSADGGVTWSERGGGLPRPVAVAIGASPDDLLYAARNRLYVASDGGIFWRAVELELPEIVAVAWAGDPFAP